MAVKIDFSVMADPIDKQIAKQGYEFESEEDRAYWLRMLYSLQMLYAGGCLTDYEHSNAIKKIRRLIKLDLKRSK